MCTQQVMEDLYSELQSCWFLIFSLQNIAMGSTLPTYATNESKT
jgi:hypothetical protein